MKYKKGDKVIICTDYLISMGTAVGLGMEFGTSNMGTIYAKTRGMIGTIVFDEFGYIEVTTEYGTHCLREEDVKPATKLALVLK
jgi:hypothetical protein